MTRLLSMNIPIPLPFLRHTRSVLAASSLCFCCLSAAPLGAQTPAAAETPKPANPPLELSSLDWLDGCWRGEVADYQFREHWLPLRGGLMVGAGHVVFQGKTQDFGYLRLETRPDGVYYVSISSAKKEASFKLTATAIEEKDTIFTFTSPIDEFPQRILYRRGVDGWLYASVEGKVKGEEKKVIYPMRRVDCQSGELLRK
jgi:Domain of unknown function (DUF6265)